MFDSTTGASCALPTTRAFPPSLSLPPSRSVAGLHAEYRRLARRLSEGDVELTVETTSAVVLAYRRLVRAGGRVDPMAAALIDILAGQLRDIDAAVCLDG